jgi:hypothetical protein
MTKVEKVFQTIGTIIFSIGIALAFLLLAAMVWGDLEASLFSSALDAETSLRTLSCPIFISSTETSEIKATFKNPLDKDWSRFTRVYISDGFITLKREIKEEIPIQAGEKETVSWAITAEDAVYDRIVFFHIYVNARYPYPSLDGSCGVVVVDFLDLTGKQTLFLVLATSLACIAVGIFFFKQTVKPVYGKTWNRIHSMYSLAVILFLGLVIGYIGAWVFALLLLAVSLLMIGIIIGRRLSSQA